YDRLDEMKTAVAERIQEVLQQRGGTFQAVTERDIVVRTGLQRLEQLEIGRESLVFGRIDEEAGDAFHIGRLAVSAKDGDPLVVDWRAPVAEPFYRATGRHPMGLVRRRHFATEGRRLVGMEDEVFADMAGGEGGHDGLVGSGALLAALERSRSGSMRDIVATVQKEQDEVIRAELPGVLVVQGGPGTGKTAVALHRAAYLLYTHRFPLERQGVLVVGPNPLFLRYIDQVLPSLGETGVALTTVEGLVADVRATGTDRPEAARVKGDSRMARVVARAVRDRQRPLRRPVDVGFGGVVLHLSPALTEEVVAGARRRAGPHNSRRRFVEALLRRKLHQQFLDLIERQRRTGVRAPKGEEEVDTTDVDLWREVRRDPGVAEALDRMWPILTPQELLHDLYGAPALLQLAGRGVLEEAEAAALHRPRSTTLDEIAWTAGDIPLLDEARVALGTKRASSGEEGEIRNYGHIVVDEAQDLTPMQLRMLARRSLSGSMTVVGDIAQATGPRAPADWNDITKHLPARRPPRVVELTINYRTPAEIMDLAGRVLAVAAPHLRQPRSVRSTETPPMRVAVGRADLPRRVAEIAVAESEKVAGGTVAVIAPASLVSELSSASDVFGDPDRTGLEAPITLVPVGVVKGLEFDSIVVVEPDRIVAESPQGLRALYVALTRATKRLTVVYSEGLPAPIR
ncbi:MAG TPA: ATP-binding domain-containing protein, partial [Acidimicrobiales bacterium]|nr:ATP-binding domain-containing protein [Acidimicrobiales bacterium]